MSNNRLNRIHSLAWQRHALVSARASAQKQRRPWSPATTYTLQPSLERLEPRLPLSVSVVPLGTYSTGLFDQVAAEIVAHDPQTQRLFITNSAVDVDPNVEGTGGIDVIDIRDPAHPVLEMTIDTSASGTGPTSVAVHGELLAVAVERSDSPTRNGVVAFFRIDPDSRQVNFIRTIDVGAEPDMVAFTSDGTKLLTANEGEPNESYTIDPEGSVSIIDLSAGAESATETRATFTRFNHLVNSLGHAGVRIYGPKVEEVEPGVFQTVGQATVAQDLEPEYLTISPDSQFAWVTLQENNALAKLDIERAEFLWVRGLGYKDHFQPENAFDGSDRDKKTNIQQWPVSGMYQPDAIASYATDEGIFLLTANEGDAREFVTTIQVEVPALDPDTGEPLVDPDTGQPLTVTVEEEVEVFNEEARVKDLTLGFPLNLLNVLGFQKNENLGRLRVTNQPPFGTSLTTDGEVLHQQLFSFGARSFSVWTEDGTLVFDSASDFERLTREALPQGFNANNDDNRADARSDDKGPEPEAITIGQIEDQTFAFVGLERIGGFFVYDITDPRAPAAETYFNRRNFDVPVTIEVSQDPPVLDPDTGEEILREIVNPEVGDLGVEDIKFISAQRSPTGHAMLVTSNEVSGTTTLFHLFVDPPSVDVVDVETDVSTMMQQSPVRVTPVDEVTIQFSEPVVNFDRAALSLTRDDSAENLLPPTAVLATSDEGSTWMLSGLASVTSVGGAYRLELSADSAIRDQQGNPLLAGDATRWIQLPGDANRDGRFDSADLVAVMQAGKFETDQPAAWSEGDFDGDGRFTTSDLILGMQTAAFEQASNAVNVETSAPTFLSPAGSSVTQRTVVLEAELVDALFQRDRWDIDRFDSFNRDP